MIGVSDNATTCGVKTYRLLVIGETVKAIPAEIQQR